MGVIEIIDGNIQIACILFLVLQYTNKVFTKGGKSIMSINIVSIFIMIAGLCESCMFYFILTPTAHTELSKKLVYALPCILTTSAFIGVVCWLYFAYFFFRYKKADNKSMLLMGIPLFLTIWIPLSSPITNLMYKASFNPDGTFVYKLGPLYFLVALVETGYLVGTNIIVFKNKKRIKFKHLITIVIIMCVPIIGIISQLISEEWLLFFPICMFSTIIGYILLQDNLVKNDFNTGTIKKTIFNSYIRQTLRLEDNGYGIAYITLKDYVKVRDKHGKLAQEQYISDFGKLLIDLADESAKIVYAQSGDYIIYVNTQKEYEIEEIIEKLARITQEYNISHQDKESQKIEFIYTVEMFKEKYKDNFGLISAAAEKIEIMQQGEVQTC